jgi:hypothetical protein
MLNMPPELVPAALLVVEPAVPLPALPVSTGGMASSPSATGSATQAGPSSSKTLQTDGSSGCNFRRITHNNGLGNSNLVAARRERAAMLWRFG